MLFRSPALPNRDWSLNWIDDFILERLQSEGLKPSPEADRVTLIRRLNFDLIGLPPKPEEVDQFVADEDPAAYEKLVDRLLASDRYGERMAIYWLDLVRFADTVGYHGDQDHNISPYREYVIDAFNDNLPLDQFTREQLAGDLIPDATTDQKIASGYNRMLQTSHEGGVQPKEYLAIYAADRVRNVSEVWLGATMGCCQCHDHKYDPLTTRDFYSLAAFFADLDESQHFTSGNDSLPTKRAPEEKLLSKRERQRLAELENEIVKLEDQLVTHTKDDPQTGASLEKKVAGFKGQADQIRESARKTMISVAIEPRTISDEFGSARHAAIKTYGDTIHSFWDLQDYKGPFLPTFIEQREAGDDCGLLVIDHCVGNVEEGKMEYWADWYSRVMGFTRYITFDDSDISTEFTALQSVVMSQDRASIRFPINEPADGRKKSQIEEYLDFYEGPGCQHVALLTKDVLKSVRKLRENGVQFLSVPDTYYDDLWERVGDHVKEDRQVIQDLGILVDSDEEGYLLQLFTQPVEDRPTLFFEIIQRQGSRGFGKGNFKALFESIEREQSLRGNL